MMDYAAANSIRNILAGTQSSMPTYIFGASEKGSDYSPDDFVKETALSLLFPLVGMAVQKVPTFIIGAKRLTQLEKVWGTPSSTVLRDNMKTAGIPVPKFPNAAHHIVPGSDARFRDAAIARTHLAKLGINSNDAANGVFLEFRKSGVNQIGQGPIHNDIHTSVYYAEVKRRVLTARNKDQAEQVLYKIAEELQNNVFPY